jgi:hypothetical protein
MQSKGLHLILVERAEIPNAVDPDDGTPPGIILPPDPSAVYAVTGMNILLSTPGHPYALPPDKAVLVRADDPNVFRDKQGQALAAWSPQIRRMYYLYGELAVSKQFETLADVVGNAMLAVPDEALHRLPASVRPLFRRQVGRSVKFTYGKVPAKVEHEPPRSVSADPVVTSYDEGVVIEVFSEPNDSPKRAQAWYLFLHRLGWEAKPGELLQATRFVWNKRIGASHRFSGPKPSDPVVAMAGAMPVHRWYSSLTTSGSGDLGADVCRASVWAIDRLESFFSEPSLATQINRVDESI